MCSARPPRPLLLVWLRGAPFLSSTRSKHKLTVGSGKIAGRILVVKRCHERLTLCIECDRHVVDTEICVFQPKMIGQGLFAVGRRKLLEDRQKRALGSRRNGIYGTIVILKPDLVALIPGYCSNLRLEHSNVELACGSKWNEGTVWASVRWSIENRRSCAHESNPREKIGTSK